MNSLAVSPFLDSLVNFVWCYLMRGRHFWSIEKKIHNLCTKRKKISGESATTESKKNRSKSQINCFVVIKFLLCAFQFWCYWQQKKYHKIDILKVVRHNWFTIQNQKLFTDHQKNTDFLMRSNVINRDDKDTNKKLAWQNKEQQEEKKVLE